MRFPSSPSDEPSGVSAVIERNLRTLIEREQALRRQRSWQEVAADRIAAFTGSFAFVYAHAAVFGGWILVNVLGPVTVRFDPTLGTLAVVASVEAIFLSTFVLINQKRMAVDADRRAQLDLQISLLSEHEITRLIRMVGGIADKLGVDAGVDPEREELEKDVAPERVLDKIDERRR